MYTEELYIVFIHSLSSHWIIKCVINYFYILKDCFDHLKMVNKPRSNQINSFLFTDCIGRKMFGLNGKILDVHQYSEYLIFFLRKLYASFIRLIGIP